MEEGDERKEVAAPGQQWGKGEFPFPGCQDKDVEGSEVQCHLPDFRL